MDKNNEYFRFKKKHRKENAEKVSDLIDFQKVLI